MNSVLIINGPNLNLLGQREPEVYGNHTLESLQGDLEKIAKSQNIALKMIQSNHEGDIIDAIHQAKKSINFIIINAAAYTHTSVAIRDALLGVDIPFLEVHISNVYAREEFRHDSLLADVAVGVIGGLGVKGYEYALDFAAHYQC